MVDLYALTSPNVQKIYVMRSPESLRSDWAPREVAVSMSV
jgi:hypothetical protein